MDEIPRYRITDEKGAYLPRSPEIQLLELGADRAASRIYGVRAVVCELLPEGTEIDYLGSPGPHLFPLNDSARAKTKAYWKEHPNATLDPTRHMPLGQDPMAGKSVEQLVTSLLESMDRGPATVEGGQSDQIAALLDGQLAMQALMAQLIGAMTPTKGK
jgi:hypothetical protein